MFQELNSELVKKPTIEAIRRKKQQRETLEVVRQEYGISYIRLLGQGSRLVGRMVMDIGEFQGSEIKRLVEAMKSGQIRR